MNSKVVRNWALAAVLAGSAIVGSPASAVVLYNESGSGDLSATGDAVGNLTLGSNEILGSWSETGAIPSDTDRFNVTLAAGLQIVSISVFYSLADGENLNVSLGTDGNLFDDGFPGSVNSPSTAVHATFLDSFGPDTGALDTTLVGSVWDFTLTGSTIFSTKSWNATIETRATQEEPPIGASEPGTLAIFGLGLAGLGFIRRRRNAA